MKALFIHAHFDDYEFTAAGTFTLWQQQLGKGFRGRVVVCTDGKAGHHRLSREETGRVRLAEQEESARIGGYEFQHLRLPNGAVPRETCLRHTPMLLPALWKAIRDFEPDYLFCPPLPVDPMAGVHLDHSDVAQAIRDVAYLINVPHAYTPEYPDEPAEARPCKVPVILTVFDSYMAGANAFDLAVDIEPVFDQVARMSWCHQSQIREWLPWVGRHQMNPPADPTAWSGELRARFERENLRLGLPGRPLTEVFTVTAWGEAPSVDRLLQDFPGLIPHAGREARLRRRFQDAAG
jgi:LmbE family N-acetylglucosaminyl deacetylase